jgi:hypothetical protein
MDKKVMATNLINMAIDKNECEKVKIKYIGDSYRGIFDNAIRILDFYEPDMKDEAPMFRRSVIEEMKHILNNIKWKN